MEIDAVLEIVFTSAGLPTHYPAAKLVLWLRRADLEAAVIADLGKHGTRGSGSTAGRGWVPWSSRPR